VNRDFEFDEKNKITIPAGRQVAIDCHDRTWRDLLRTVNVRNGAALQVERCKLNGFDLSGLQQPSGSHIMVSNSIVNFGTDCQVCSGARPGRRRPSYASTQPPHSVRASGRAHSSVRASGRLHIVFSQAGNHAAQSQ
jgi:hypothetical protein